MPRIDMIQEDLAALNQEIVRKEQEAENLVRSGQPPDSIRLFSAIAEPNISISTPR